MELPFSVVDATHVPEAQVVMTTGNVHLEYGNTYHKTVITLTLTRVARGGEQEGEFDVHRSSIKNEITSCC